MPSPLSFPVDSLENLTRRVLSGEAVFFVGSGLSIDSEKTSTERLLGRLFARFVALTQVLSTLPLREATESSSTTKPRPNDPTGKARTNAKELLTSLTQIFALEGRPDQPARLMSKDNLWNLTREYYHFNDWMCSAFGVLLRDIERLEEDQAKEIPARLSELENELLQHLGDDWRIPPLELASFRDLEPTTDKGKVLFLDTMGFTDPTVMRGDPLAQDPGGCRPILCWTTATAAPCVGPPGPRGAVPNSGDHQLRPAARGCLSSSRFHPPGASRQPGSRMDRRHGAFVHPHRRG